MAEGAEDVPVVYLHDIKREYRQGEATLTVLNGAKLALWPGQSVALVAPSGCDAPGVPAGAGWPGSFGEVT